MRRSILAALLLVVAFAVPVHGAPKPCRDHLCPPPPSPPPTIAMARLWTAGAETNFLSASGATLGVLEGTSIAGSGTLSIGNATVRSGAFAFKFDSGALSGTPQLRVGDPAATALASGATYYLRAYINITDLPTAGDTDIMVVGLLRARLKTTGALALWNQNLTHQIGSDSAVLNTGTWYRVELKMAFNSAADDTVELQLDGTSVASATEAVSTALNTNSFQVGWVAAPAATSKVFWADDIAINDSTGASQNSWPGDGHEVLLIPTADSAVGTGWTLGTGTATGGNAFVAVDNEPPTGVADLTAGSDPKQIRNASSNANVNYDATMTTYTAAGIAAADTINVIDPVIATAAPVTTSAKAGTVGVASNPAIANVALGAAGTAGAFWSGLAGGTYPTGWKISHGTITYGSAVTVGTAPVMRITQVTSSTRIAVVCFMGMYVDYTPAPAVQIAYVNVYPPLIAQ